MALLTPMLLEEARTLGAAFGLDVVGLEPIPFGSVNSNFALDLAGGGRAFLRVCEESDATAVAAQNELLLHLVAGGVPTPAPLARRDGGGTLAQHRGKPAVVFPFREGGWICQKGVRVHHTARVGEALARIHRAGASYRESPPSRFGSAELRQRLAGLGRGDHGAEIAQAVALLGERLDELDGVGAVPTTVIHGDVFRDNVLWQGSDLSALLDFESASFGHPVFDLMVAMLAWCFGEALDGDLARAMIAGYCAARPLAPEEAAACFDEARRAAVRFAVTRITDYELRPAGVVVYKDFRRFTARLAAVEAIGRAHFPAWLGL